MVSELRDYDQINAELTRRLNLGEPHIRLVDAGGQRLLIARISGPWNACIEVLGHAGPELAAELDAAGVTVVCRGRADDGAGRGLIAGRLLLLGDTGAAIGYAQRGGTIITLGRAGPRAGLNQQGGDLLLLGPAGPLAGERQAGGQIFLGAQQPPHAGRGRRSGRLIALDPDRSARRPLPDPADEAALAAARDLAHSFHTFPRGGP